MARPDLFLAYLDRLPLPVIVYDYDPQLVHPYDQGPLLLNGAFRALTRDKPLSRLFTPAGKTALRTWILDPPPGQPHQHHSPGPAHDLDMAPPSPLLTPTENGGADHHRFQPDLQLDSEPSEAVEEDVELLTPDIELELLLGDEAMGQQRSMIVRWRRELMQGLGPVPSPSGTASTYIVLTALMIPPLLPAGVASLSSLSCGRTNSQDSISSRGDRVKPPLVSPERVARPLQERLTELEILTDLSPVGLARLDMQGRVLWVNDSWYRINGLDRSCSLDEWPSIIHPDSVDALTVAWTHSLTTMEPLATTFKLVTGAHVLAHAIPNAVPPAIVTGWISNITDISAQVTAEEAILELATEKALAVIREAAVVEAKSRQEAAEEQRRQQELLIDVTSHELRQPISAIIQCAELTRNSLVTLRQVLAELDLDGRLPPELQQTVGFTLEEDIESLDSISDCAMAQEIIANDILGLAQIQINHLSVAYIPYDLTAALRKTIKMFASECKARGITLTLNLDDSLSRLGNPRRIKADPTRMGQIMINLLSNAIRFTATTKGEKLISLSVQVSSLAPSADEPILPPVDDVQPGEGDLFLYFQVTDTGPGMSGEETAKLFSKFMQASPLVHCTNGGSGLGLWISRNLTEIQGGRIEVISELGKGSTFRGYVACQYVDSTVDLVALSAPPSPLASPTPCRSPRLRPGLSLLPSTTSRAPNPSTLAPPNLNPKIPRLVPLPAPSLPILPLLSTPTLFPSTKRLRVLAVDDNDINRKIIRRQLENYGHLVDTASNGQEAVDMFLTKGRTEAGWHVILMDIEMPILSGLEATRVLRAAEVGTGHSVRIVGLSSNARDAQIKEALKAGMDCLVTKPYRITALLKKLEGDF